MATWTTSRNNHLDEAVDNDRAKQSLMLIKDRLTGATTPWTLIGYGTGTGGSSSMNIAGVADPFPAFPSIVGVADNAWICVMNDDGEQVVLQVQGDDGHLWWSCTGDYTTIGDEAEDDRPGNTGGPADEVTHFASGVDLGYTAAHYASIAVSDDGNSFIYFAKQGTGALGLAFTKLEDTKAGDTHPYWSYMYETTSPGAWAETYMSYIGSNDRAMSYHPAGGVLDYPVSQLYSGGQPVPDVIVPDPFTSDQQLVEVLAVCMTPPRYHIRGKIPGILRNPDARSMGDTFDTGAWMCMGEYALPWGDVGDVLL